MRPVGGRCWETRFSKPVPLTKKERAWADEILSPEGQEERLQEREGCVSGITFDAGGLIALDRNDRQMLTLLAQATEPAELLTWACPSL